MQDKFNFENMKITVCNRFGNLFGRRGMCGLGGHTRLSAVKVLLCDCGTEFYKTKFHQNRNTRTVFPHCLSAVLFLRNQHSGFPHQLSWNFSTHTNAFIKEEVSHGDTKHI